jgi:hypothetical protein
MNRRPADLHIDDLANPLFSPDVDQMLQAVAPLAESIGWTLDAALEQASAEAGLTDFGEDIYRRKRPDFRLWVKLRSGVR